MPLCLLIPISVFKASHFNTDVVNRAGFSKLFMDHSDKMWARGKVDITFFTHYPNYPVGSFLHIFLQIAPAHFKTGDTVWSMSSSTGLQDMMKYVLKRGGKMGTSFQVKVHLKAQIFLRKSSITFLTTSDPTGWQWKPNCWKR